MRETKSTQRRRRLRIIKAKDSRSEERIRSTASVLENNSHLRKSREDAEQNRQRLATACGATLPTRFRLEHPAKETQHVLMNRPSLLIGSHPECDLQLDDVAVHPRHRLLQWVNGHLFCCDLAPRTADEQLPKTNGQWVDARPITIGPYQLFREADDFSGPPVISPLDRSPELSTLQPQLALQFLGVEQSDNKWPINRLLTMIGRGSQCKLRLNHPSMPHVQACLLRMENSCWLIDVERAGTTGVHGRAIRVAPIGIGDVLQLGPFRVEVVATTFTPINPSPSPSVAKEEISARSKMKLFAPNTADLCLPQRNGSRKSSPPPKSLLWLIHQTRIPTSLKSRRTTLQAVRRNGPSRQPQSWRPGGLQLLKLQSRRPMPRPLTLQRQGTPLRPGLPPKSHQSASCNKHVALMGKTPRQPVTRRILPRQRRSCRLKSFYGNTSFNWHDCRPT